MMLRAAMHCQGKARTAPSVASHTTCYSRTCVSCANMGSGQPHDYQSKASVSAGDIMYDNNCFKSKANVASTGTCCITILTYLLTYILCSLGPTGGQQNVNVVEKPVMSETAQTCLPVLALCQWRFCWPVGFGGLSESGRCHRR